MDPQLVEKVLNLAMEIQQIPAPTFAEGARAVFIRSCFQKEKLADVASDEVGNVYARLPGAGERLPIVISAHLDTVFPATTELSLSRNAEKISGPGIGDNAVGVAGMFGLLWAIRQSGKQLPGDLWLVANVCEEGLGDLRGMRAVVERFKQGTLAYIVLEGMALGQIYHRGLGVRRYRITVCTPGGHSWVDHGQPSAVHVLASLVTRLVELPLPAEPRTTLNAGVISGGLSVNTIAAEAHLELDLRSVSAQTLDDLVARVKALIQEMNQPDIRVTAEAIGQRPVGEIPAEHPLVTLAIRALETAGLKPCLNIGSTDANFPLSLGLPAICLGLTLGSGAHTLDEHIYTRPLAQGLSQLVSVVRGLYRQVPSSPHPLIP